ncbi:MAG TPA: hypothetical protein VNP94_05610 [Actinomycetota bacterium]|nr:hypothetical protein [Actinomycetota bacterium]
MRTRHLIAALAAALLAAACGRLRPPAEGGIPHPTGPDDLVLRVATGGGFVPPAYAFRELPSFSLYGDGRLIRPGATIEIYPGPALPGLYVTRISEEGVQAILARAREAGLLGPDRRLDWPVVADAPWTTFTVAAGGVSHVVSAYALGFEEGTEGGLPPGVTEEEAAARRELAAFLRALGDLRSWLPAGAVGPEEPYEPHALRVLVEPWREAPDPALAQPEVAWPLGPLAGFGEPSGLAPGARCGVVEGSDLRALLPLAERANELTSWTSGGERYLLTFRPLLPDESGC